MAGTAPQEERRRAARIYVAWDAACEKTSEILQELPPELKAVYERINADSTELGRRFAGTLRDLSVNGAFVEGDPLPLMSRVALVFDIPAFRKVEAIGW